MTARGNVAPEFQGSVLRGDVREMLPRLDAGYVRCLYADPPWHMKSWSEKGDGRSACRHYQVMRRRDLMDLGPQVQRVCADDCHLFMWTTWAHLEQALEMMRAWGFAYSSTAFIWAKTSRRAEPPFTADKLAVGMGHTTRKQTEPCLLGRRGSPSRKSKAVREAIIAPLGRHSAKPRETYRRIEQYCDGPRLELFARHVEPGWDAIGNEAEESANV